MAKKTVLPSYKILFGDGDPMVARVHISKHLRSGKGPDGQACRVFDTIVEGGSIRSYVYGNFASDSIDKGIRTQFRIGIVTEKNGCQYLYRELRSAGGKKINCGVKIFETEEGIPGHLRDLQLPRFKCLGNLKGVILITAR